jgi:hypothetical protein
MAADSRYQWRLFLPRPVIARLSCTIVAAAHLDAEALLELRVCDVAVQLGAVVVLRCVVEEGLDHDAALAADVCSQQDGQRQQ